jgi:hypothetical protein
MKTKVTLNINGNNFDMYEFQVGDKVVVNLRGGPVFGTIKHWKYNEHSTTWGCIVIDSIVLNHIIPLG